MVTAIVVAACGRGGITSTKSEPAYAGPLDAGVVRTPMGLMRGMVAADYRLFQGIPYAAPPVGPLRWQPPRPAAKWSGTLDASKPGPQCMQDTGPNPHVGKPTSENCLTLNVWTPAPARGAGKRPVMVWIHGGGFVNGSSDIYYSRWLASRGHIVVVTINYRLGRAGISGPPVAGRAGQRRKLRAGRPAGRIALGPRPHRRFRRRSAQGDDRRRIRGWHVGVRSPGGARVGGAVPCGDHPKRALSGASRLGDRPAPQRGLRGVGGMPQSRQHSARVCVRCRRLRLTVRPGMSSSGTPTRSLVRLPGHRCYRTGRSRHSPPVGRPAFRC